MKLENLKVGLGITGSFCNFGRTEELIDELKGEGAANVIPIVSYIVKSEDTRFYKAERFMEMLEKKTGNKVIDTVSKAEPIGPKSMIDVLLICPCTGNSIAKLSNGISDTPVLMAAKSQMRNNKPIILGISTNDGLGRNAKNIGELLIMKSIFFVPFCQDDYIKKPKSLTLDYDKIVDTIEYATRNEQLQPLIFAK